MFSSTSIDTGQQKVQEITQLADILGTYVWVYSGDLNEFSGGDVEDLLHGSYKDEKEFITKHSITFSNAKHLPGQPVKPKNVNGHVTWGSSKIIFNGVRIRTPSEGYWEILKTEDQSEETPWLDDEGNAVGAAVVHDDNGFPFLIFDWNLPLDSIPSHLCWLGYYVGKRLVDGKDWRLTDKERRRLGIGRKSKRVAQIAKEGKTGVDEDEDEDEDEDSQSGTSDEESDVDEEDTDADGSSEGEAASKDVGEKRKASDGEMGANKRRRD